MPAAAGTRKYEKWRRPPIPPLDSGLRRNDEVGAVVTVAGRPPLPAGRGPAPALHFSCDPGLWLFGRRWLVSPAGAGIHPGSESGTCFRTNRSCRLVPAHQGMKIGCIG